MLPTQETGTTCGGWGGRRGVHRSPDSEVTTQDSPAHLRARGNVPTLSITERVQDPPACRSRFHPSLLSHPQRPPYFRPPLTSRSPLLLLGK